VEILPSCFRSVLWVNRKLKEHCWGSTCSMESLWPCRGGDEQEMNDGVLGERQWEFAMVSVPQACSNREFARFGTCLA